MAFKTLVFLGFLFVTLYLFNRGKQSRQLAYIHSYQFHPTIRKKVQQRYPHLSEDNLNLVFDALRDYFTFCNQAKKRMVAMPSQVVDVAWHEFIIFTRSYEVFTKKAIGRFLHHTPTEAMKTPTAAQDGIKRAWRLACAKENINPTAPTRLPLLFSIDQLLRIDDGFHYTLNCKDQSTPHKNNNYCAGHIGCATGCVGSGDSSSSGGFFDFLGDSSDGGGGGCGGD